MCLCYFCVCVAGVLLNRSMLLLKLTAVVNDNLGTRGTRAAADPLDGADHVHSLGNGTKDHVLAVQPVRQRKKVIKTPFVPMVGELNAGKGLRVVPYY